MLRVSIITPVFNNKRFVESAIKSVLAQRYPGIEYIVVDGGSTDGTLDIINKYKNRITKIVSEKDRGLYDGINKGIRLSAGDIIGNLNSDDFYANADVIKKVVEAMEKTGADACWGDLVYVDQNDSDKIIRYWTSSAYQNGKFRLGWMPPHPTFFVRRRVYERYGLFNVDFKIAADYELMLRILERHGVKSCYIPEVLVKMRVGGVSNKSIKNIIRTKFEDYRAWKINNLKINPLRIFLLKPLSKVLQYFKKS